MVFLQYSAVTLEGLSITLFGFRENGVTVKGFGITFCCLLLNLCVLKFWTMRKVYVMGSLVGFPFLVFSRQPNSLVACMKILF